MARPQMTDRMLSERNIRDAQVLKLLEHGVSPADVAERLGKSVGVVHTMAVRARKRRTVLVSITTTTKDHPHG